MKKVKDLRIKLINPWGAIVMEKLGEFLNPRAINTTYFYSDESLPREFELIKVETTKESFIATYKEIFK